MVCVQKPIWYFSPDIIIVADWELKTSFPLWYFSVEKGKLVVPGEWSSEAVHALTGRRAAEG